MRRAFYPADILLPKKGTDMSRWSVIACDQFTSEPDYWEELLVRDWNTGAVLSRTPGTVQSMPDGQKWFLV